MQPIYYSKIEFREELGFGERTSIILLNLPAKELSYQVFRYKRRIPVIQGTTTMQLHGRKYTLDINAPAVYMSNEKTNFKPHLLKLEPLEPEMVFSFGINITDTEYMNLLPFCNALDFEPYRNRKMSMSDSGYVGYRDEIRLYFSAITDSPIPMIELPMNYYYDEDHIWPSEKLYRYLLNTFFAEKKELAGKYTEYGGLSLFY